MIEEDESPTDAPGAGGNDMNMMDDPDEKEISNNPYILSFYRVDGDFPFGLLLSLMYSTIRLNFNSVFSLFF